MPEVQLVHIPEADVQFGKTLARVVQKDAVNWLCLPYELWLTILVDYGVSGRDLVSLEYSCSWFGNCWGGKCKL